MSRRIMINRAPVLTLWAAVVAKRLGHPWRTALTLGKAVAGLNAQSKGRRLGIYEPSPEGARGRKGAKRVARREVVELLGRQVPVEETPDGARAVVKDKVERPDAVRRYLEGKFGDDLAAVREAMEALAASFKPHELAGVAYDLYERFRPEVPAGKRGWGAKGTLDLDGIRRLSR